MTTENNIAVLMSLNELVMNSTDNDQSIDNIIILSNVLNQTAILISGHAALPTSNLTMVRKYIVHNSFNSATVQSGFPMKHAKYISYASLQNYLKIQF